MAKDKEKRNVELRPVDESAGVEQRVVRLHFGEVEEVEDAAELPILKVGVEKVSNEDGQLAGRVEKNGRSQEPDMEAMFEQDSRDTEDDWQAPAKSGLTVSWGWWALAALFFSTGIIWSLVQVRNSGDKQVAVGSETIALLEAEEQSVLEAEATLATIEKVTEGYFNSKSVEELLRYARHSERVKPLMESYYASKRVESRRVSAFVSLDPITLANRANFWFVTCILDDGTEAQVMVEVFSENDAKVDWETHVTYQPLPWDEFAIKREGGYTGDFRVLAEQDNYYSYEFTDSVNLVCLRLSGVDTNEVLYGYVERNSAVWGDIKKQLERNSGWASPMILRLHVPVGLDSPRGVVIKEVIALRWLLIDNPEEP